MIPPTFDVRFDPVKMALGFIEGKEATKNRNLGHILYFLRDMSVRYIVIPPTCDVRFDPVKMALGFIEGKEATKNRNLGHILYFLRDRYTII